MSSRKLRLKKVFLLLMVLGLGVGLYFLWNGSLFGSKLPKLSLEGTRAVADSGIVLPPEFTLVIPLVTPLVSASPIVLTTPTPQPEDIKPVCGQKKPMTFLVLGIDDHEQSDVIRIVRVDFIGKRILVLSIPRDFWVNIPGMSAYGITESKVNAAYGYGEYFLGAGKGVVVSSATLFQNYGITFDRYVVFHFSNFVKMIDAVGGVDVVLDAPIGVYGTVGTTHLDGKTALEYAWNRDADNDNYRVLRQSALIRALFEKILKPENMITLPGLGVKFLQDKTLLTDISIGDISTFICLADQLTSSSLILKEIPSDLYTPAYTRDGKYIDIPSPDVRNYIQNLVINGNY